MTPPPTLRPYQAQAGSDGIAEPRIARGRMPAFALN